MASLRLTIPPGLADELEALEVDTLSPDSPAGKAEFVAAFRAGRRIKSGLVVILEGSALDYAARPTGAFGNAEDILRDQAPYDPPQGAKARAARRLWGLARGAAGA